MIEDATYAGNSLLQEIRKQNGSGRATDEGIAEPAAALQNKLRSGIAAGSESSRNAADGGNGLGASNGESEPTERATEGSDSREGRASTTSHESDRGADRSYRSDNGSLPDTELVRKLIAINAANGKISYSAAAKEAGCSATAATNYLKKIREGETTNVSAKSKPSGLAAKPHAKEQQLRQEQAQAQTISSEKGKPSGVKGIFSFINSAKGKERPKAEKENIRSKPLSESEAQALKPALIAAMMDYFKYMDEVIYATNKAHAQVQIWSAIDSEECEVLANVWIGFAKRSARSATRVVAVVNSHAQLEAGIILLPKFYQTFRAYADNGGIGIR